MKRALLSVLAAVVVAALAGCARDRVAVNGFSGPVEHRGVSQDDGGREGLVPCGRYGMVASRRSACPRCGGIHGLGHGQGQGFDPGPPAAQITYPYYTLRGPRDFLQRVPSPIGP